MMKSPRSGAAVGGTDPLAGSTALVIALVLLLAVGFEMLRGAYLPVGPFGAGAPFGTRIVVALQIAATPLGVAMIFMAFMGRRWTEYGLRRSPVYWRLAVAILAAVPAVSLVWRSGGVPPDLLLPAAGMELGLAAAGVGIAAALAAGAAEEMLVRGFLLNEISRLSGGRWGSSVLAVSLAAGIGQLHRGFGAVVAAVMGHCVFGFAYLLAGRNLTAVVLAHLAAVLYGVYGGL